MADAGRRWPVRHLAAARGPAGEAAEGIAADRRRRGHARRQRPHRRLPAVRAQRLRTRAGPRLLVQRPPAPRRRTQHRAGRGPGRRADRHGGWRRPPLEQGVRREADRHHGGRSRRGLGAAGRAAHHRALSGRQSTRHPREDLGLRAEEGARRDPRDRRSRSPSQAGRPGEARGRAQPQGRLGAQRQQHRAARRASGRERGARRGRVRRRARCRPQRRRERPVGSSDSRSTRSSCRTTAAAATSSRRCWPPRRHGTTCSPATATPSTTPTTPPWHARC